MNSFRLDWMALCVVGPALLGLVAWYVSGLGPKVGAALGIVLAAIASVMGSTSFVSGTNTSSDLSLPPLLPFAAAAVGLFLVLAVAFGLFKRNATR
jgi:hypothetical protein